MRLLAKLMGISGITALSLLLAIVVFSVIIVLSVRSSSMETAVIMGKDKLTGDMVYFEDLIFNEYGRLSLHDGKLVGQDSVSLEYRYELVDKLSSGMGIVATVFVRKGNDYRRISTSIVNESGERVINTFLGTGSAAYPSVHAGNEYSGNAVILGRDYLTHYRPIFASNNRDVIGILFIGMEMTKIGQTISQNTAAHVNQIIIIALIILLVLIAVNTLSLDLILVKPIRTVTTIISRLSTGDINQQIDESKKRDEIGTMRNELKHLINGLKRTADFAQNIGKGNLNAEYQPLSGDDVLGNSLLEMRQSLQNAEKEQLIRAKEDEHRNWVTAGLANFAEILRQDNASLEALSYNIISNLVKYLGANQGGIFILNDADDEIDRVLEMTACYAFDRKKFTEKQIRQGEGLVGTCYLEGETIYITDVPDKYMNITSGLGKANPRVILICPLKVNDVIYGVIELASFRVLEPYHLDFVHKVCESIASTISSVKVNIRTSQLLAQSKLQAEEMVNQEEELRQNMEEMQATQEEMYRREAELQDVLEKSQKSEKAFEGKTHWYEALLDAFEETPISVTDMDKKITFLNKSALTILGTTREATMGKYCGDVWNVDICKDERCGIECLKRGKGKSEFQVGDTTFTTLASYIKDSEGNNIGHIEVVDNVTK